MKIYVAGKSGGDQTARCAAFMARLRALSQQITYDWTKDVSAHERQAFAGNALKACAIADIDAVRKADAVIVLYHPNLRGALVEIGAALALMTPVLVVGVPAAESMVFYRLCHHVDTEDEAVAFLPHLQALALHGGTA